MTTKKMYFYDSFSHEHPVFTAPSYVIYLQCKTSLQHFVTRLLKINSPVRISGLEDQQSDNRKASAAE